MSVLALSGLSFWLHEPLIWLALLACALGDLLLSRAGDRWFLLCMGFFALGHLLYAFIFFAFWHAAPAAGQIAAVLLILAAAGGMDTLFWRSDALRWPVLGYIGIVAAMALSAWVVTAAPALWIGVMLFVRSNSLIAIERFGQINAGRWASVILAMGMWMTYWIAQALILISVLKIRITIRQKKRPSNSSAQVQQGGEEEREPKLHLSAS